MDLRSSSGIFFLTAALSFKGFANPNYYPDFGESPLAFLFSNFQTKWGHPLLAYGLASWPGRQRTVRRGTPLHALPHPHAVAIVLRLFLSRLPSALLFIPNIIPDGGVLLVQPLPPPQKPTLLPLRAFFIVGHTRQPLHFGTNLALPSSSSRDRERAASAERKCKAVTCSPQYDSNHKRPAHLNQKTTAPSMGLTYSRSPPPFSSPKKPGACPRDNRQLSRLIQRSIRSTPAPSFLHRGICPPQVRRECLRLIPQTVRRACANHVVGAPRERTGRLYGAGNYIKPQLS